MNQPTPEDRRRKPDGGKSPETREARLKTALQANIARRKAQARARAAALPDADAPQPEDGRHD